MTLKIDRRIVSETVKGFWNMGGVYCMWRVVRFPEESVYGGMHAMFYGSSPPLILYRDTNYEQGRDLAYYYRFMSGYTTFKRFNCARKEEQSVYLGGCFGSGCSC
jgi:hypothetical protein